MLTVRSLFKLLIIVVCMCAETIPVYASSSGQSRRWAGDVQFTTGQRSDQTGHERVSRTLQRTRHVRQNLVNRYGGSVSTGCPSGRARAQHSADPQTTSFGTDVHLSRTSHAVSAAGKPSNRHHAIVRIILPHRHLRSSLCHFRPQLLCSGRSVFDCKVRNRQPLPITVRQ